MRSQRARVAIGVDGRESGGEVEEFAGGEDGCAHEAEAGGEQSEGAADGAEEGVEEHVEGDVAGVFDEVEGEAVRKRPTEVTMRWAVPARSLAMWSFWGTMDSP
jgi:hypothetical protein